MAAALVLLPTLSLTTFQGATADPQPAPRQSAGRESGTPSRPASDCLEACLKWRRKAVKRLQLAQWFEQKRNDWRTYAKRLGAAKHRKSALASAPSKTPWYVSKQMWAGNILGRESAGDPWPNCPDPYDGGGSWQATVNCENGGSWLDSPGYYRCGLQFAPHWEIRFGRLCP